MLEQLLTFVTPGPLTEKFGFQTRVFTSWISFGLILGLISSIALISSGTATPDGVVVFVLQSLIIYPFIICFLGLTGLGLDSMRGDTEHPGWYWWLFPIVTYIVIGFWFFVILLGFAGVNLPISPRRHQRRQQQFNPEQFRREVQKMKVEDLLKDFREQIEQLEQLERQGKLNPQQEKVIRKIRTFDRSKYDSRLRDLLDRDNMEELILVLLILLGVEVR
jgi:hypothetical protein